MLGFDKLFEFEEALAEYTGAPYVIATDSCTHALELCLRYDRTTQCEFSAFTYLSVPMLMHQLGIEYQLTDERWIGEYNLHGTRIWDSARLLRKNMYRLGQLQCLSFGNGKPMQLGRVGCILTDDVAVYKTLSRMRSDGRDLRISPWISEKVFPVGFHYTPTLESCQKGIDLLPMNSGDISAIDYPDLRYIKIIE
jgi:dTDP-4-amino-4,6-dideoxygalactose transaminase